jgi:hypothetical protein
MTLLVAGSATIANAEITQKGGLRVTFEGQLTPHALPRTGAAPVRVTVGAKIAATDGATPPQLRRISIAINRNGHFEPKGLPVCPLREIQPSTTADALAACRSSLVGEGSFAANVIFSAQAPFPSQGKVFAFNGVIGCSPSERHLRSLLGSKPRGSQAAMAKAPINSSSGAGRLWPSRSRTQGAWRALHASDRGRRAAPCHRRPAILAHVYGTNPVPTSFTLPFELKPAKGTFGTVLTASLPAVTASSSYITGLSLTLGRSFTVHGKRRSYLSAGCPAPKGFPGAVFPFAKATLAFAGRGTLTSTLTRSCGARG